MSAEIRACRCTDFWAFHHPDCPAMQTIRRLRAELAACGRDAERYRTALEQILAPFEDLNFVSGNKLLTYIHDTATSALAADGVAEDV